MFLTQIFNLKFVIYVKGDLRLIFLNKFQEPRARDPAQGSCVY